MRTITRLAVLCGLILSGMGTASADQWERLGSRNVNFGADRDVIPVGLKGKYKKIKVKVTGNAIHLADLKVHFANGGVHDVSVRADIPKGGETRVIDLPGAARVITKITVVYRTKFKKPRRRGKAEFHVFGKKATASAPVAKPLAKPLVKAPVKWVHLGTRDVRFGAEKDVIPVTAASGMFKRIKFKVRENAIHMIDMKVHFGNGTVQDVSLRFNIPKGGESRVIDLAGAARVIKKITLRYKSHGGLKGLIRGHAKIDIYGVKVVGSAAAPTPVAKPKPAPAPAVGKWVKLGERTVKPRVEKDTIHVGIADGRFTKLKFRVKTAPVPILDMKVRFKNGGVKDVALRAVIPAGGESRVIDLPGNKRIISGVTFWYKEQGKARRRPGRPHVALWGRR